jgi:hypothetical protein
MEAQITYQDVVAGLAPCGIDCERCVMYAEGRVRRLAVARGEALEGFETMAPRVADRVPPMRDYDRFTEVLGFFTGAGCAGCRAGGSQLPFCAARTCFREQGVDFCFQCAEYPCGRNAYPENLARRWRAAGDRMREVGAEEFYRESLTRPRY